MGNYSFVQCSFLGGEWSPRAQGRMTDARYKTAMNVCLNSFPTEEGAWVRRSGMRYLQHSRHGAAAKLQAFDFKTSQPYQIELSDGYVRFFAGLELVKTTDSPLIVDDVSADTPARVYLAEALPAAWVAGDTVMFSLSSIPASCPALYNRQFTIGAVDTASQSFTILDPITGDGIDGSTLAYDRQTEEGQSADTVSKVFEIETPYTGTDFLSVRAAQDDETLLLFRKGYQPRVIEEGSPFAISIPEFKDGPYLDQIDEDDAVTTLTFSGTTGSITVTASDNTDINDGQGFLSTDVGRLLRVRCAPADWSASETYAKKEKVTGDDGVIYKSQKGANTNHDPTTDDGTYWIVTADEVLWTWLEITAYTSSTVVTATVKGDDLTKTAATIHWRIGVYGETLGWPTCGTYHEGRLFLAGAIGNRIDGSKSNKRFNFSPTDTDGQVADDNAVSGTFNAREVNTLLWLLSTDDGLIAGSQGGEWRIRASSLDDPISPFTLQARRVSTYGCADCEAVNSTATVFVQRAQRKLLAHRQVTSSKYLADNVSHLADHLVSPGVEEISWQQEPNLTLWSRCSDGSLVGTVFQRSDKEEDNFEAFHDTSLGSARIVESVSSGPAYDGLSDAMYAVTNQTDSTAPDYGIRWVECLMPTFDDATADWGGFFTDGGTNGAYVERSSTGVIFYGLWHLNGQTVAATLGGLDLGDHAVSGGSMAVAYGSDPGGLFTRAFFENLSDGTDYDVLETVGSYIVNANITPSVSVGSLLAAPGEDGPSVYGPGIRCYLSEDRTYLIQTWTVDGSAAGWRKVNATSGEEEFQSLWPGDSYSQSSWCLHRNGYLYGSANEGSNSMSVAKIDVADGTYITAGTPSSALLTASEWNSGTTYSLGDYALRNRTYYRSAKSANQGHDPLNEVSEQQTTLSYWVRDGAVTHYTQSFGPWVGLRGFSNRNTDLTNYVAYTGMGNSSGWNNIYIINGSDLAIRWVHRIDEACAGLCRGPEKEKVSTFYAMGKSYTGGWVNLGFYAVRVHQPLSTPVYGTMQKVKTIVPSDIVSTWGTFVTFGGPGYDEADGNILFFISGSADNEYYGDREYLVKINAVTGEIMWKCDIGAYGDNNGFQSSESLSGSRINGKYAVFRHINFPSGSVTNTGLVIFDTLAGTMTVDETVNDGLDPGSSDATFDYNSGAITFCGSYSHSASGTTPIYVGRYLAEHGNAFSSKWARYYAGLSYTEPVITEYSVPSAIGYSFTSRGQLLRPDYGNDAGMQGGPAFGKKRRIHQWAASFFKSRGVSVGTDFGNLRPICPATDGGVPQVAPTLFSGIYTDTLDSGYSWNEQIAWEITRPYPATILAMGGYIQGMDK